MFAAVPDDASPEAWDGLRELVGPGGSAILARPIEPPDAGPCRSCTVPPDVAPDALTPANDAATRADTITPLTDADVPEMLALVERTKPGPFGPRTIELGTYLGIRDRERKDLVAMAGERLHPPGYTEISAVCTDAAHRGRGLASLLVRALVQGIRDRGETPFLHLTRARTRPARASYSELGFETRRLLDVDRGSGRRIAGFMPTSAAIRH